MRPRLFASENAVCLKSEIEIPAGFNEAEAVRLGKLSSASKLSPSPFCFNEAEAVRLGKHLIRRRGIRGGEQLQ